MDISFSGAGFMGCYYFGVVDCWNKYVPRDRVNRVAGASAGSLIAAYYLMDLPLSACIKEIIELTEDIRRRPLGVFDRSNQIVDVLPKLLDRLLPEDAHKQVSGRLHVCMTRLKDMKKVIVNEFESKKDLIDALNCSCFIPVWSGNHVSTFRGVKHIDGGFSDNLPVFDEHTIRVCCFSGPSDISPYDRAKLELLSGTVLNTPFYLNLANCRRFRKALFPPPADYIVNLLERGFHDTKDFILSNDLIQCDACYRKQGLSNQPLLNKVRPTITPQLSRNPSVHGGSPRALGGSLNSLVLLEKLRNSSPDSAMDGLDRAHSPVSPGTPPCEAQPSVPALSPPTIVVEEYSSAGQLIKSDSLEDSAIESDSDSANSSPRETPREKFKPALRRNTLAQVGGESLLAIKDKFTLAPNPLPSCPPSPNLNRHCTECIRLRQEARNDLVEDEIRREAEKYRVIRAPKESKLKSTLASPIRWLRQVGVKSSYNFGEPHN